MISKKLIAILLAILGASGCGGTQYHVDYGGDRDVYIGAKDSYRAGQTVVFYYDYRMVATDTDYSFYVDGEEISATYEEGKGFRISFEMPTHDVTVECRSVNSMIRGAYYGELTFSSFDGGGPEYTVRLEDPTLVTYQQIAKYADPKHEEMDGSAFDVIITFEGKKPGQTTMTVEERSPIIEGRDITYTVEVDDALRVYLVKESEVYIGDNYSDEEPSEE